MQQKGPKYRKCATKGRNIGGVQQTGLNIGCVQQNMSSCRCATETA